MPKLILKIFSWCCGLLLLFGCTSMYYLDAPVNDRIMFADNTQNSDLARVEDGGLVGATGECPT